jgi:hypothetical protein
VYDVGGEAREELDLVAEEHGVRRSPDRAGRRAGRRPAKVGECGPGALRGDAVEGGKLHPPNDQDRPLRQARGVQVEGAQERLAAYPEAGVAPRPGLGGAYRHLADLNRHRSEHRG